MDSTPMLFLRGMQIDGNSAVPIYQQLKDNLVGAITQDTLHAGDRLPSEREFCEHLGISRLTVRRALNDLTNGGWLFSRPGKGTYVRGPKLEQGVHQLMGLTEDMRRRGYAVTSKILQIAMVSPSPRTARLMQLAPRTPVVLLERLRSVDGEPLAIEHSYLNHQLCPGIMQHDLTASLYQVFRETYGLLITKAEQDYEAIAAGWREAQILGIAEGAPILSSERTTYVANDQVVEQGRAWYRGDRYRFHTTLLGATGDGGDLRR